MSYTYTIQQLDDSFYSICDVHSVNMYLIIGEKRALLFDTGFGFLDLRELLGGLTDMPIIAIDSHADPDHALGNYLFEDVYLSRYDYKNLLLLDGPAFKRSQLDDRLNKPESKLAEEMGDVEAWMAHSVFESRYHFVDEGDSFDLGGTRLEVVALPGHTTGSIALIDRSRKRVFTGDSVMDHNVYYMDIADAPQRSYEPLSVYYDSLRRLRTMVDDNYLLYPAHGPMGISASAIDDALVNLQQIHEREGEETELVTSLGYPCFRHVFGTSEILYSSSNVEVYRKGALLQ